MARIDNTVVLLTPGFAASEDDTTCLPLQQSFVRRLKTIYPELNIEILAFQYPYFIGTYKWHGINVMTFNGKNKGGIPRWLLRQKLYKTLDDINARSPIAALLSFWCGECALVGQRFAVKNKLSHYSWIMGQDAKKENKYPAGISMRPRQLIALSDFLQNEFQKNHGTRPANVIPFGIERADSSLSNEERTIDILAAGSLIPLKQFDLLPAIVAEVKKRIPNVKVMLAGEGPERTRLVALINEAGLQTNFQLSGELSNPLLLDKMADAKVFLHPSSYEGFSGVCLEALSRGARVISFCAAMDHPIDHWDIVNTKEEMIAKTITVLQQPGTDHSSSVPYQMDDIVTRIYSLIMGKQ